MLLLAVCLLMTIKLFSSNLFIKVRDLQSIFFILNKYFFLTLLLIIENFDQGYEDNAYDAAHRSMHLVLLASEWFDSDSECKDFSHNMFTYNNCFVWLNINLKMIVMIDDVHIIERSNSLSCPAMLKIYIYLYVIKILFLDNII